MKSKANSNVAATATTIGLPLPPLKSPDQKTVVLDLDHTLISCMKICPESYDFTVKIDGHKRVFYIIKRPYVDEFLQFLSEHNYEIVVFTAAIEPYASLVLDELDPNGLITHRLYRDSCKINVNGEIVKDLSGLGRDLKKVVIVDDNPSSYSLQPDNGIPIREFTDRGQDDDELMKLKAYFCENSNRLFFKRIQE